jgi:hypothetical protein
MACQLGGAAPGGRPSRVRATCRSGSQGAVRLCSLAKMLEENLVAERIVISSYQEVTARHPRIGIPSAAKASRHRNTQRRLTPGG